MAFLLTGTFLLSGCSGLLDQVNDTTTYVTEANEYVTDIQQFTEDFPQLAEEAVQDAAKRADLTQRIGIIESRHSRI